MWITKTISLVVTHHFYLSANEVREWFSDLGDIWRIPGEEEFLYFKNVRVCLWHVFVCGMYVVCVYVCVVWVHGVYGVYMYVCVGDMCVLYEDVPVCGVCVRIWYVVRVYMYVECVWCICM